MIKKIIILLSISIILTGCQAEAASEQKAVEKVVEQETDTYTNNLIKEALKDDTPTKTAILKMYFPDGKEEDFIFNYYKQNHQYRNGGYECQYYEHDYIYPIVYIRDASVFYRTVTKDDDVYNVFNGTFTIDLSDEGLEYK